MTTTETVRGRGPTIEATDLDYAWAAGFLEGEGSFGRSPAGGVYVCAQQVDAEPLHRLAAILGGPVGLNAKPTRAGRDIYHWAIYGRNARRAMRELRPYMSSRRQDAIDAALSSYVRKQDD